MHEIPLRETFILVLVFFAFRVSAQVPVEMPRIIKKEIPLYTDGVPDNFYRITHNQARQMKLDSLENGFDSVQIRVWYEDPLSISRQLLVMQRSAGEWSAKSYKMTVLTQDSVEMLTDFVKKDISPLSGWAAMAKNLNKYVMTSLPNMDDIPGLFDSWKDGETYCIEVATTKQYRFYCYHVPEHFQKRWWQAQNMVGLLNIFEKEFRMKRGTGAEISRRPPNIKPRQKALPSKHKLRPL
ncbi:MAG: hypothetical protein V4543_06930 [Bacteroidota bacterium]